MVKLGKDSNLAIWFGLLGPQRGDEWRNLERTGIWLSGLVREGHSTVMSGETWKGQEFGYLVWSVRATAR